LRVLVVDDNATNRQILIHQLLAWKMQPVCATDGEEALNMMRGAASAGTPYRLALLDFQMPEMDGLDLARAIKSDPAISSTRLIMLTSHGQLLSPSELEEFGIDSCVIKPAKQSRLFDCIANASNLVAATGPVRPLKINPSPSTASSSEALLPNGKLRILLADDNQTNRKLALAQLRILGYEAQAVTTGLEAVRALEHRSYDVILMDCQMPELDGYEATESIRQRERASNGDCPWNIPVHIIAMTAHAMQGEREKCLAAGMDDYLAKPVRTPDLKAVLERFKKAPEEALD
jgi:two-component system, sensor histidine kinase and response regulator